RYLNNSVRVCIKKTVTLNYLATYDDAPVYTTNRQDEYDASSEDGAGSGRFNFKSLYKDLMNGISAMLPFVIAGGIIIAISFLIERFAGSVSALLLGFNGIHSEAFTFLLP